MPYCFKCGVEVSNGVEKCPLCNLELPVFEDEKIVEPRYPEQENFFREIKKRRRSVFFSVYTMIIIAVVMNLIFIDWRSEGSLNWSLYASIYLLGSLIYMVVILQYFKNSIINFSIMGINTLVLLFLNDIVNGQVEWFYPLAFYLCIFSVIASYFIFQVFQSKRLLPYKFMWSLFIIAIFLVFIELCINKFLFNRFFINWSLQTVLYFLPVITIIILLPRRLYERFNKYVERKIHI